MTTVSQDLGNRLVSPKESGLDPALFVPLLRLLAEGEPVALGDLAVASGHTIEQVRLALAAVPDTEYDEAGRIVGQGLTLRPTRHRFTVDGQELYTWCALDTLIFPALIETTATIESVSPASGETVRVTATPTAVTSVEPAGAVVSLINPEDLTSIRSAFCNQVHYFTSPEDAQAWLADHPGGEVVPVAEAYRLAADLVKQMPGNLRVGAAAGTADDTAACATPQSAEPSGTAGRAHGCC
ncbi:organomercurial lyase MerB [Promicromonospora sp. NPDC023987]|uniref:organomercurial lyase MerB n=1 Tax=Promicromonospora sp. NPDC023987 TaxID=3155360 RepID=UPI0034024849